MNNHQSNKNYPRVYKIVPALLVVLALSLFVQATEFSKCTVLYADMNQSDGNIKDYSYLGNTGSAIGAQNFISSCGSGFNGCYNFSSGAIDFPYNPAYEFAYKDFSIALWFNSDVSSGQQSLVSNLAPSGGICGFDAMIYSLSSTFDVRYYIFQGGVSPYLYIYSFPTVFPSNEWHFAVYVVNRETEQGYVYLDGALIINGSLTMDNSQINNSLDVLVGKKSGDTQYFVGMIDEVSILNCSLTASDVSSWYADYDTSWLYPNENSVPSQPTILFPENNSVINVSNTLVLWNYSSDYDNGTLTYSVFLNDTKICTTTTNNCSVNINNGLYQIYVFVNDTVDTNISETTFFEVSILFNLDYYTLSPFDNEILYSSLPTSFYYNVSSLYEDVYCVFTVDDVEYSNKTEMGYQHFTYYDHINSSFNIICIGGNRSVSGTPKIIRWYFEPTILITTGEAIIVFIIFLFALVCIILGEARGEKTYMLFGGIILFLMTITMRQYPIMIIIAFASLVIVLYAFTNQKFKQE